MGIIPFSAIEEIGFVGNEYTSSAQIYCHFKHYFRPKISFKRIFRENKGKSKFVRRFNFQLCQNIPYQKYNYYTLNKNYDESVDYYWDKFHYLCNENDFGKKVIPYDD